jgi:Kdo-III transferase WaaZ
MKRFHGYKRIDRLKRFIYKVSLPRSKRHFVRTFPHLRLDLRQRDVWWKKNKIGQIKRWSDFPNGVNQLVVVGSGPSVKGKLDDLSKISDQEVGVILLNGAATLVKDGIVKAPLAVIVEDARFILEKPEIIYNLPKRTRLILSASALHALCYVDSTWVSRFDIWFMDSIATPYKQQKTKLVNGEFEHYVYKEGAGLSKNLSAGHFGCGTVMYAGIQLAFHLRVRSLFLVGFDLTNFDVPRFYETSSDKSWSGVQNSLDNRILPALKLMKEEAITSGMEITNCSDISVVPEAIIKKGFLPAANESL